MSINVANAVVVLKHGHARGPHNTFDEGMAAPRNDEINVVVHHCQVIHAFAVREVNELDAVSGKAGALAAALEAAGDGAIGFDGLGAAAQDGGVTGLETKRRGVARDVGARFINDGDDANGHTDLVQTEAVGPRPLCHYFPHRIG
jgi:hypothetical protein